jgi:hypothetical protein
MPLSRKSEVLKREPIEETVARLHAAPPSTAYPRRLTLFVILRDESGSMSRWREQQGTFVPALRTAITDAGGPRVGDLVYLLYGVVSGGVVFENFAPLSTAKDPVFEPDGHTPIGEGLKSLADKVDGFISKELIPNEVSVRDVKVAIISDLHPTEEEENVTAASVQRFVEVVKRFKADVQLVGPSESAMNQVLATSLDVSGNGVKYLDNADPRAVFTWTFDSILSQSRKLSGSRPRGKKR